MIFFLVTSRNVFLILDILENAGTSKCFILVSFQLHKCISEKKKKKSRINRYCISSKNFNQLTKFFELFENVNLSKVIALYYF